MRMGKAMINVIGLGYIGLPTTLMLAAHGNETVGTDLNETLVEKLNSGEPSFKEQGIEELLRQAKGKSVRFSSCYEQADIYIVAVPTPYDSESKKIDAFYVVSAVQSILEVCPHEAVIVIESTISPGTIDQFIRPLIKHHSVHLAHAPERIIPGNMLKELTRNPRIIGVDEPDVGRRIKDVYATFCQGEIVITDIRTAELVKVIENTYRDVNIAFANELSRICHKSELNVQEVIRYANMHPRVNILQPGPGVGGHCISVDPWFLVGDFPEIVDVIHAARRVNDGQPAWILSRIKEIMAENGVLDFSRVGLYGLTYKENVDDIRESPALQLLDAMPNDERSSVRAYDPFVAPGIVQCQMSSLDEFLEAVDLVVVLVGHDEIKKRTADLAGKVVYDTRNVGIPGACAL